MQFEKRFTSVCPRLKICVYLKRRENKDFRKRKEKQNKIKSFRHASAFWLFYVIIYFSVHRSQFVRVLFYCFCECLVFLPSIMLKFLFCLCSVVSLGLIILNVTFFVLFLTLPRFLPSFEYFICVRIVYIFSVFFCLFVVISLFKQVRQFN